MNSKLINLVEFSSFTSMKGMSEEKIKALGEFICSDEISLRVL